jgi:predicted SAM-dependent methyltransferase
MKMLNLGCGEKYHPAWINIDFVSNDKNVIAHNLLKGIPFGDNEVDVVYHAHVLEHFSPEDGKNLVKECFRVLKPGGILRVGVPDLENIIREYIRNLEGAKNGDSEAAARYEWIKLELLDQMVRHRRGGN